MLDTLITLAAVLMACYICYRFDAVLGYLFGPATDTDEDEETQFRAMR